MKPLQTRAMLVRLTVHAWTARKKDANATKDVDARNNATDAGNYIKLLVDKAELKPFQTQDGKIREYYYKHTLAWSDNGDRLLPSTAFFDFTTGMRDLIADADRIAEDFTRQYPGMVAAARQKLGMLYNPEDYPDVSTIRRRFGIELDFSPVPDADDFRVDVGQAAVDEIKAKINKGVDERQKEATKELWTRLHDAVTRIADTLSRDKPRIFDSLMETPRELVSLLPKLNFANDVGLTKMCGEVDRRLLVEPNELRNDIPLRLEILRRAQSVRAEIDTLRYA